MIVSAFEHSQNNVIYLKINCQSDWEIIYSDCIKCGISAFRSSSVLERGRYLNR